MATIAIATLPHLGDSFSIVEKYESVCKVLKINNALKGQSLFLYGDSSGAFEILAESEREIFEYQLGTITCAECCFYLALSAIQLASGLSSMTPTAFKVYRIIYRNRKHLQKWAKSAPENFLHKYLLIRAELFRIRGNHQQAMIHYERAIHSARESSQIHIEALANELAARFYLQIDMKRLSDGYLLEAHRCYDTWGASGKVRQMEEQHPGLFGRKTDNGMHRAEGNSYHQAELEQLDLMLASETIATAQELDSLVNNLIHIVERNAGATKGVILVEHGRGMRPLAEGVMKASVLQINRSFSDSAAPGYCETAVRYARRTDKLLVVDNAATDDRFRDDPRLYDCATLSLLCMPMQHQRNRAFILYLENDLLPNTFTADRISLLNLLSSQIAVSLENALLQKEKQEILSIVHDSLSSDIYSIFLLSEGYRCGNETELSECKMKLIGDTASKGLQTIRDFLFLSSRERLVITDFVDMVRDFAYKLFADSDVEVDIIAPEDELAHRLDSAQLFSLFLVCKEALANVRKHSSATRVTFLLELEDGGMRIRVADNGIGFEPALLTGHGHGLGNIRSRITELGGILDLNTSPGNGLELDISVPIATDI